MLSKLHANRPLGLKRLIRLAKHIVDKKKRGHKVFDFSKWNGYTLNNRKFHDPLCIRDHDPRKSLNKCGTNGCAIGECPIVFKKYWKFTLSGGPQLRGDYSYCGNYGFAGAATFFNISHNEALKLFCPDVSGLGDLATAKQVSRHILNFVAQKEKTNA